MQSPILSPRLPRSIALGEKVSFSRTISEADVALFIGVTWDVNPYHTDEEFCKQTPFKRRIVPGLLTAGLLTHLGGLWAFLATSMHFEFLAPVFVGDTIRAEAEIVEVKENQTWVRLSCRCVNQNNQEVLKAEVTGYPGKPQPFEGSL